MTGGFDMSEYLGVFLEEAEEQVTTLEEDLVRLEREGSQPDLLQEIFRAAHTLKGASASMGFTQLAHITHSLENVLDALRNEVIQPTSDIVDVLFRALDILRALKDEVAAGTSGQVADEAVTSVVGDLKAILGREQTGPSGGAAPAAELSYAEYDRETMLEAGEHGLSTYEVHVTLREGCPLKGIRAALVINELNRVGEAIKTSPPPDDLEEERFGDDFRVLVVTAAQPHAVSDAVSRLAEIANVTVAEVSGTASPAAPAAASVAPDGVEPAAIEDAGSREPITEGPRQAGGPTPRQAASVRVSVEQLDNLMNMVAELVIDRTMLEQIRNSLAADRGPQDELVSRLEESVSGIRRRTTDLQDQIMKARLLPIGNVFSRFPRMLRDLAQKASKRIDFTVSGGETELDRSVLDYIADPLIHILRNSVDHGIESPADRVAAGKPETGAIDLSARHQEGHIVIETTDDGRGIDPERVKAAAVRKGQVSEEVAARMSRREAIELIFASGMSTAEQVTDVSGRGVGMDIVRTNIERLSGSVEVASEVGLGTTITVRLPLTLAIIQALLVRSRGGVFAIPLSSVVEAERRSASEISTVRGHATLIFRERVIPLIDLAHSLRYTADVAGPPKRADRVYVVVVSVGDKRAGLIVEGLIGEQEVVIKGLGSFVGDIRGVSGATILGDGTVALILDVAGMLTLVMDAVAASA